MTTSTHDPFSARFDSIEIDPSRQSLAAIDHALALAAPSAAAPEFAQAGFYLMDDAGGRFIIDREMGVVSLKDAATLERERFSTHTVRVNVIEQSGHSYEMEMQLRLTGLVPQMVGAEDALFSIPPNEAPQQVVTAPTAPFVEAHWTKYAAAHGRAGKAEIARTRRSFIQPELPVTGFSHATLTLGALPPVGLAGDWSL